MGLVDPDSLTQRFDTAMQKAEDGRVLFSWWPWFGGAYNTTERTCEVKGFMPIYAKTVHLFVGGIMKLE